MAYRKILNKLITEELSISSNVYTESLRLWDKILDSAYKEASTKILPDGIGEEGFGHVIDNVFGIDLDIVYTFYNFNNKKCFEDQEYDFIEADCAMGFSDGAVIHLSFPMINWTVIYEPKIKDALHHELEHLFQGSKGSQKILKPNADYQKARQLANSSDEDTSKLGVLMYFYDTSEQDAFVNGLYSQLMSQEKPMAKISWEFIKSTDLYYHLERIREIKNRLKEPDKALEDKCRRYFNRNTETMLKIAKTVEIRILKKIGKVLAKYYKDIREKYPIKENLYINRKNINYFC